MEEREEGTIETRVDIRNVLDSVDLDMTGQIFHNMEIDQKR